VPMRFATSNSCSRGPCLGGRAAALHRRLPGLEPDSAADCDRRHRAKVARLRVTGAQRSGIRPLQFLRIPLAELEPHLPRWPRIVTPLVGQPVDDTQAEPVGTERHAIGHGGLLDRYPQPILRAVQHDPELIHPMTQAPVTNGIRHDLRQCQCRVVEAPCSIGWSKPINPALAAAAASRPAATLISWLIEVVRTSRLRARTYPLLRRYKRRKWVAVSRGDCR
jgi:hypothetical protein